MDKDKRTVRKIMQSRRRALPILKQQQASQAVLHHFLDWISTQERKYKNIGFYFPREGEIDTHALIQWSWQQNILCYLPKVCADFSLLFGLYTCHTVLKPNRWGLHEPQTDSWILASHLDLLIMPLVAFDGQGHRLGQGAGCYDRSLQGVAKPLLVGLAYDFQEVARLPSEPHDVSLSMVITENHWRSFEGLSHV